MYVMHVGTNICFSVLFLLAYSTLLSSDQTAKQYCQCDHCTVVMATNTN